MRTKTKWMAALLVLNLCLFGFGFYFVNSIFEELGRMGRSNAVTPGVRARLKASHTRMEAPQAAPVVTSTTPTIAYITNQFHWSQVESPDYREYIANLRRIGCPEPTIKDIIFTDIMRLYAARRWQFHQNGREFRFWETNEKRELTARQMEAREKQLAQIDKEIPAVLRELLGVNYERELNKYFIDDNADEQRLAFMSEEKRSRVLALREEIEGLRESVLQQADGAPLNEAQRKELARIEAQRLETLTAILTPEEIDKLELSTSQTAERLRNELIGFNPNEEEFRQIFNRQKALDEKFAFAAADDPAVQQARAQEEARMQEELQAWLGEGRYNEYTRSRNPDYREACLFAEMYELSPSTASSIIEIKQIAEREKQNLLAATNLAEETRDAALKAIRVETEKSLRQILGTKILSIYSNGSGRWVGELGAAN